MPICSRCGIERDGKRFRKGRTVCKNCHASDELERYHSDPKAKEKQRDKYKRNPQQRRDYNLRMKFGITLDDYNRILEQQGGVCDICGVIPADQNGGKSLAVDHDHYTGKVRGLLCHHCNHGLGKFKDSPDLLRNAARYLERNS